MSKKYTCPVCQSELKKPVCDECGTDIRELFAGARKSTEEICEILAQSGAFIDGTLQHLVIPGHNAWAYVSVATQKYSGTERDILSEYIRNMCNLSVKRFGKMEAQRFLFDLHQNSSPALPVISHVGDKPQLFLHENGELIWPFTVDSRAGRMWQYSDTEGLFYTGPFLTPRPTGAFEAFLDDCRFETADDRAVMRQWMRSAICPTLFTPGQFPALLICARTPGSGKTTTAYVLGDILGGSLDIFWGNVNSMDDLNRMLMDPANRVLIVDNIVPASGHQVFDDSGLAHFITQKELTVKILYRTHGSCKVPARYQYIFTGNHPQFSSELLGRCTVVTLHRPEGKVDEDKAKDDWRAKWFARRVEILEDLLYTTMENWKQGDCGALSKHFRFVTWQKLVQRLDQSDPVVIPITSKARSPLTLLLLELWEQYKYQDRVEFEKIQAFIKGAQTGIGATVKSQIDNTWIGITADLDLYHGCFSYEKDEGGQRWIVRR